jgi:hypothetical protein
MTNGKVSLFKVLLGELIPPLSELLPDVRPLLGKRLWSHARALPTRGVWLRHPYSSCDRPRRGPRLRRHGRAVMIPAHMGAVQWPLYPKSEPMDVHSTHKGRAVVARSGRLPCKTGLSSVNAAAGK